MNTTLCSRSKPVQRTLGIVFGLGTQVFFLVTVWYLFCFLKDGGQSNLRGSLWVDALLAMQFAVPHSLLLMPSVRNYLGKRISREFYPLFYCTVTCVNLLITIGFWRTSDVVVWELSGATSVLMQIGFYASWLALIYSLNLSGFGTQTGLPQWWRWVCRRPLPASEFKPRGAYLWLRHPVYLSFAGLIWFTPTMTIDHAILTGLWTMYIFFGSVLKDLRMTHYLGNVYRDYQRQVPGFPLFPFGPLAKLRAAEITSTPVNELSKASVRRDGV